MASCATFRCGGESSVMAVPVSCGESGLVVVRHGPARPTVLARPGAGPGNQGLGLRPQVLGHYWAGSTGPTHGCKSANGSWLFMKPSDMSWLVPS
jgi:hypothetical protein